MGLRDLLAPLAPELRDLIVRRGEDLTWLRQATGEELFRTACDDLQLDADSLGYPFPEAATAVQLGDLRHAELVAGLQRIFTPGTGLAELLADQIQLRRAFADPVEVTGALQSLVMDVVDKFPRTLDHLRRGQNRGDVLDPFILSANFELMSGRDLVKTVEATASHKVLMKIEDLLGNLHQTVIGAMRGNFRVPEPQGVAGDKETLHPVLNPFPGVDVGQVPTRRAPHRLRLFQVKSKTGSAKGGDGKRLGEQLKQVENVYGAHTFYAAIVGNTLKGHRSRAAVAKASPNTAILVGRAALNELTQSEVGGELLLRTYQRAFRAAAEAAHYDFAAVIADITEDFAAEAKEQGDDFLTAWLHLAIDGTAEEQDSRRQVGMPDRRR